MNNTFRQTRTGAKIHRAPAGSLRTYCGVYASGFNVLNVAATLKVPESAFCRSCGTATSNIMDNEDGTWQWKP